MKENRFLKTALCFIFTLCLIMGAFQTFYANEKKDFKNSNVKDASDIKVYINGQKLNFDTPPKLSEGRTLVPLRKIVEALGYQVDYNNELKRINLKQDTMEVVLGIDHNFVTVKDKALQYEASFALEAVPSIYGNRTYVPLRTIGELCAAKVTWEGTTKTINIESSKLPDSQILELRSDENSAERYYYKGEIINNRPLGVGFMRYGYESSSFYQGMWIKGQPYYSGFMKLSTGVDTYFIIGEFAKGRLLNGTVTDSMGISIIRNGVVQATYGQAGADYWKINNDPSIDENWQKMLVTELPKFN